MRKFTEIIPDETLGDYPSTKAELWGTKLHVPIWYFELFKENKYLVDGETLQVTVMFSDNKYSMGSTFGMTYRD